MSSQSQRHVQALADVAALARRTLNDGRTLAGGRELATGVLEIVNACFALDHREQAQ